MMKLGLLVLLNLLAFRGFGQTERIKENIDFNWNFHLGDVLNGQALSLPATNWKKLNLPHDWSITGKYTNDFSGAKRVGFLPCGIGWYRKVIYWDRSWKNKKVAVVFDGVYMNSQVWINGHYLGIRPYGYSTFHYDLTPYLKKGRNLIAVRVDNAKSPSARWYTGSGIYRHVWLIMTNKIHLAYDGTYVTTPNVTRESATVHLEAQIRNESGSKTNATVTSIILDENRKEITRQSQNILLDTGKTKLLQHFIVGKPALWSPETPTIYYVKTVIHEGTKTLDSYVTSFGIRTIAVGGSFGFKLNGKVIKLKGMADHENAGAIGAAIPEDIRYHRLKLLKEMGCNAIRATTHPFAPEFYEMCDTMGFLVLDEAFDGWAQPKATADYGNYWDKWWKKDLSDFIKRDRNHPSVVIWSMGNEVKPNPAGQIYDSLQKRIYSVFKRLDPTRPVTQAYARGKYLDIAGFNGDGEHKNVIPDFHKQDPQMPIMGTEMPHTRQTRGVYRTKTSYYKWDAPAWFERTAEKKKAYLTTEVDPIPDLSDKEIFTNIDRRYASSYDNQTLNMSVRAAWKQVLKYDFFMGEFRWTGFDYLGEAWSWPSRTNNYGIIDLAEFPKDDYYLYQSLWTTKPMVHLLPHWTHPGMEGVKIPVVVYTNGDAAELFLNGKSLGKKKMNEDTLQIVWRVPYHPGLLLAVAYKNGKEIARDTSMTAGPPAGIRLFPDRKQIQANRRDVVAITVDIVDGQGIFNPTANDTVHFKVTGPYQLLGVENGDILDMSPQKVFWRKTFMGKALLLLQATDRPGIIHITATGGGLKPESVSVVTKR